MKKEVKRILFIALLVGALSGCATLGGLMQDLNDMTPEDYATNSALAGKATSSIPTPYGPAATAVATWVIFLARNKYKEYMRNRAAKKNSGNTLTNT